MAEIISDAEISALEVKSAGSAKPLGPSIPGVGDPAKQANDIIKKEADKHAKQIKILAGTLLLAVMSGVAVNNISEVNRQIEKLNKFGEKIKATIDDLKNFISLMNIVANKALMYNSKPTSKVEHQHTGGVAMVLPE